MPIVVEVVTPEEYAQWVGEQKKKLAAAADDPNKDWTLDELKAEARRSTPPTAWPATRPTARVSPARSRRWTARKIVTGAKGEQIDIVLNGKTGTAMPAWKQLSDIDIAAVITYKRNTWANKTGDMVQPAEVNQLSK